MPSPDIRPYVDLTLFDRSAQEIVDVALADALVKFPDWEPREGNTEVVLIEALGLEVAEAIFAINRLPGAVTEVLLRLFDLNRDPGAGPTTTVRFNLSDALGHEVPIGTTVRLDLGEDVGVVDFTTDVGLVVPNGAATGVVAASSDQATIVANGVAPGTVLELVDAVPYVDSVVLETAVAGGLEPETGEAFLDRGAQVLRRLVETLVTPDHFVAHALGFAYVYRAMGLDNYNPAVGPVGANGGHVTIAVLGPGGLFVSAANKTALETDAESKAAANLNVHVIDPTLTPVDVTVEVLKLGTHDTATVAAAIDAALTEYLSPDTWGWGSTVYRNELIALIDRVPGVDRVVSITVPAADLALAGVAPLATPGTFAITVTAP